MSCHVKRIECNVQSCVVMKLNLRKLFLARGCRAKTGRRPKCDTSSNSSRLVSVTLWACFNVLCEGFLQATCLGLLRSFADDDSGLMLRTRGRPAHMNTEGILRAQNGLLYIDEARDAHLSRVATETFFQLVGDFAFSDPQKLFQSCCALFAGLLRRRRARVGPIVHKQIPSRATSTRVLLEQTTKMRRKQRSSVRTRGRGALSRTRKSTVLSGVHPWVRLSLGAVTPNLAVDGVLSEALVRVRFRLAVRSPPSQPQTVVSSCCFHFKRLPLVDLGRTHGSRAHLRSLCHHVMSLGDSATFEMS